MSMKGRSWRPATNQGIEGCQASQPPGLSEGLSPLEKVQKSGKLHKKTIKSTGGPEAVLS